MPLARGLNLFYNPARDPTTAKQAQALPQGRTLGASLCGRSSVGRALGSYPKRRRFDPDRPHPPRQTVYRCQRFQTLADETFAGVAQLVERRVETPAASVQSRSPAPTSKRGATEAQRTFTSRVVGSIPTACTRFDF